jgi:hypothetical protein
MSLRKAINTKCKECIYDLAGSRGKWRKQEQACSLFQSRRISKPSRSVCPKTIRPISLSTLPYYGVENDEDQSKDSS